MESRTAADLIRSRRRVGIEVTLEPSPAAPSQARASLASLRDSVDPEVFDDLQLVVSELVTNSVKYGPGEAIKLNVRRDGDAVVGDVTDRSEGAIEFDRERRDHSRIGRWGLPMVDRVSDDWGLRNDERTVWFRFDA